MIRLLIAFIILSALMYPSRKELAQETPKWDGRLAAGDAITPEDFARWNN